MDSHLKVTDTKKLQEKIQQGKSFLVVPHVNTDPDALTSALAVYEFLKTLGKDAAIVCETDAPSEYNFLHNFEKFTKGNLIEEIKSQNYDTILFVDSPVYKQFLAVKDTEPLTTAIKKTGIVTLCIDHHPAPFDAFDIYVNRSKASAVEDIYVIFCEEMGLKLTKQMAETVLLGMIGETGRFLYKNPNLHETFRVTEILVNAGASIEDLTNMTGQFTPANIKVIKQLLNNLTVEKNYHYSYLSDDISEDREITDDNYKASILKFVSIFIRKFNNQNLGFIVYPRLDQKGQYGATFRSSSDDYDVRKIVEPLGGGGHSRAAGADIQADTVENAVKIVKQQVEKTFN